MTETNLQDYINVQKIKAIYKVLFHGSFLSMFIGSFFTAIVFWETKQNEIFWWLLIIYLAGLCELTCTFIYKRIPQKYTTQQWESLIMFTSVFTSMAWAMLSVVMYNASDLTLNYIFITLLLGVSVGGAFTTISLSKASFAYIFLIISSLILKTIFEQKDYYIWFVFIQVLFIVYCSMLIKVFNNTYKESILSGYRALNELKLARELEEEKLKSIQAARLASLGEMAAGISHEINNPLSLIRGRVEMLGELLSSKKMKDSDVNEFIKSTQRATDRINKIIQSMKNLSRIKDESEFSEFNLEEIIHEVNTLIKHRLELQEIDLIIEGCDQVYYADKSEISQVLLNLFNNAIDAISKTKEKKWIKVVEIQTEKEQNIHIIDSGEGISSEKVEKIFNPFYTSKEVGQGTGLGLSLSKSLMVRNQGDLYYNKSFENTCFTISFKKRDECYT